MLPLLKRLRRGSSTNSSLALAHVSNVIAYYLHHRDEIDAYLSQPEQHYGEETVETLRREFPQRDLERRMRERRNR